MFQEYGVCVGEYLGAVRRVQNKHREFQGLNTIHFVCGHRVDYAVATDAVCCPCSKVSFVKYLKRRKRKGGIGEKDIQFLRIISGKVKINGHSNFNTVFAKAATHLDVL